MLLLEGVGRENAEGDYGAEIYYGDYQKEDPDPAKAGVVKASDEKDQKDDAEKERGDNVNGKIFVADLLGNFQYRRNSSLQDKAEDQTEDELCSAGSGAGV